MCVHTCLQGSEEVCVLFKQQAIRQTEIDFSQELRFFKVQKTVDFAAGEDYELPLQERESDSQLGDKDPVGNSCPGKQGQRLGRSGRQGRVLSGHRPV